MLPCHAKNQTVDSTPSTFSKAAFTFATQLPQLMPSIKYFFVIFFVFSDV